MSIAIPALTRRRVNPDVPEDVEVEEALLHLNDPNWDCSSAEITPLSDDSFELDHKHKYASSIDIGPSIGTAPSDFDTESRADSRSTNSRLQMRSTDAFEYEE